MMIFTHVGETQAVRLGDWLGVLKEVMKVFNHFDALHGFISAVIFTATYKLQLSFP